VTQIIPLLVQRGPELAGVHSKKTMMMIVVAEFSLLEYYSLQRVYWTPRLALTGRPTTVDSQWRSFSPITWITRCDSRI
jgi:hypothetical protein